MLAFHFLWYLIVLSMFLDDNIALFGIIAAFTGFYLISFSGFGAL